MLTAELLKPHRLNALGRTWERGTQYPIDLTTARSLAKNPRFQVNGLMEAVEALASGKSLEELGIHETPETDLVELEQDEGEGGEQTGDLLDRIREAADALDVDVDENFDHEGKPSVEALSKALGEEITVEQRDEAIAPPAKPGQLVADEKPAGAAPNRALKIRSNKPRPKKKPAAKPAAAEKAVEV
jgi:hypothetical protein